MFKKKPRVKSQRGKAEGIHVSGNSCPLIKRNKTMRREGFPSLPNRSLPNGTTSSPYIPLSEGPTPPNTVLKHENEVTLLKNKTGCSHTHITIAWKWKQPPLAMEVIIIDFY